MTNRVLILFAHPALQKSSVNRRLITAVRNLENVTINDLYEEYSSPSLQGANGMTLFFLEGACVAHEHSIIVQDLFHAEDNR